MIDFAAAADGMIGNFLITALTLALAAEDRLLIPVNAETLRNDVTHDLGSAAGSIQLLVVVHLDNVHIGLLAEHPGDGLEKLIDEVHCLGGVVRLCNGDMLARFLDDLFLLLCSRCST